PDSLLLFSRPYYDLRLVGDGGQRVLLPPASNRVRFSYPALSSRTGAVAWGVFAPSDPTANLPPRYALGISAPRTTKWETYGSFVDLGAATFSPDESQVAVEAERSRGIGELLILDRGTGEFRPVAGIKSPAAMGTIAWSSDGRSLVFEEEFEKNSEVWTIDLRNG